MISIHKDIHRPASSAAPRLRSQALAAGVALAVSQPLLACGLVQVGQADQSGLVEPILSARILDRRDRDGRRQVFVEVVEVARRT